MVELIAHRAGNTGAGIETFAARADGIEMDVHLHRGQIVVRHAKRIWLTSRLWDRWFILPPETEVPLLGDVLEKVSGAVGLWIDCKGVTSRLPQEVLRMIDGRWMVTLSTKSWWVLSHGPHEHNVRTFRSVGNRFEMLLLRILPARGVFDGIVVHSRLLNPDVITGLHRHYELVFSWSIADEDAGRQLIAWGIDGLIVDDLLVLDALAE